MIATEWDATFTLFDGVPTADDIDRLRGNVPKQEAGRVSESELSLSAAPTGRSGCGITWSTRWPQGRQPDPDKVGDVGYLMRTTAVYGSGKFGAADREMIADRPECRAPFQVEMLSVFLTRAFVMDLVEHMARMRNARHRRTAGPGLAPPLWHRQFHRAWHGAVSDQPPGAVQQLDRRPGRALARVRSLPMASAEDAETFRRFAARALIHARAWTSEHPIQIEKLTALRADMEALQTHLADADLTSQSPWNRLWLWGETALSVEGQEQLASLLLEPYGELVDGLSACMYADEQESWRINGAMQISDLKKIIESIYGWALAIDWSSHTANARVWYVSEAKLEPRLGERFDEPIEPYEQPLCPGRDAARMFADLANAPDGPVAAFLLSHPQHRHIVRRAQIAARYPYAEIRDNTIDANMLPVDLLRAKLSFFGACHFDPRSDRWLRINMFQNAPFPHELASLGADGWTYPPLPEAAE